MNEKLKFLKNFSYTLFSNILSTLVSMIITLLIPKLIGIEDYGYFQLYNFYVTFLGIFHLGWVDGIYLKIGGENYNSLDNGEYSKQFHLFIFMELLISLMFITSIFVFISDKNKAFVLAASMICMVVYNSTIFIQFILLATNEIRKYSILIIGDRLVYLLLIFGAVLCQKVEYRILILCDLFARSITLCYSFYSNKELLKLNKISRISSTISNAIDNIRIGYKVTFGGVAGIFIIGIARFFIENKWGIETFGKVSLSLTVSNLLMVLVNSVSLVMFPALRRMDQKNLPKLYSNIRNTLMAVLLGMLVFYYPFKEILSMWLPQYSESLKYMALLFPMCIFNSKTVLLITTYLKSLRKENIIFLSNLSALFFSVTLSFFAVYIIGNLDLAIVLIFVSIAFRSIFSEILLSRILKINVLKDVFFEVLLSFIFIVSHWYIKNYVGSLIYLICYFIYIFSKRNDLRFYFTIKK